MKYVGSFFVKVSLDLEWFMRRASLEAPGRTQVLKNVSFLQDGLGRKTGLNSVRESFTSITVLAVDERDSPIRGDRSDHERSYSTTSFVSLYGPEELLVVFFFLCRGQNR